MISTRLNLDKYRRLYKLYISFFLRQTPSYCHTWSQQIEDVLNGGKAMQDRASQNFSIFIMQWTCDFRWTTVGYYKFGLLEYGVKKKRQFWYTHSGKTLKPKVSRCHVARHGQRTVGHVVSVILINVNIIVRIIIWRQKIQRPCSTFSDNTSRNRQRNRYNCKYCLKLLCLKKFGLVWKPGIKIYNI